MSQQLSHNSDMAYQLMGNNVEVQLFRLMVKIIFTRMICLTGRVNQPPEWQFLRYKELYMTEQQHMISRIRSSHFQVTSYVGLWIFCSRIIGDLNR
jgi:hypothetical protein